MVLIISVIKNRDNRDSEFFSFYFLFYTFLYLDGELFLVCSPLLKSNNKMKIIAKGILFLCI